MGLILPQEVSVCNCGKMHLHLSELGYDVPYRSKIEIPVEHLLDGCNTKVQIECDYCGEYSYVMWKKITGSKDGKVCCESCNGKHISDAKRQNIVSAIGDVPNYWSEEWLKEQYIDFNRTAADIANECKVNTECIEKYLHRFSLYKSINRQTLLSKEDLYRLYVTEQKSCAQISAEIGISSKIISALCNDYDIVKRTQSEVMEIYYSDPNIIESKTEFFKHLWTKDWYRQKVKEARGTQEFKAKRAKAHSITYQHISNENDWNGFLTPARTRIRNSQVYAQWRESVFERDNYTCQCCGAHSGKGNPVFLNAHHVESFSDHPDLRFDIDNGITLCNKCHDPRIVGSFHNIYGSRNATIEQLYKYFAMYGKYNTKEREVG